MKAFSLGLAWARKFYQRAGSDLCLLVRIDKFKAGAGYSAMTSLHFLKE